MDSATDISHNKLIKVFSLLSDICSKCLSIIFLIYLEIQIFITLFIIHGIDLLIKKTDYVCYIFINIVQSVLMLLAVNDFLNFLN